MKSEKKDKDKDRERVMERKGEERRGQGCTGKALAAEMSGSGKAEIGVPKHSSVEEKIWRTIY